MSKRAIDGIREALIQGLMEGTAPWQKPWKPGDKDVSQPYNASSGRAYTGWSNIVSLWIASDKSGYTSPAWVTFKQAKDLGIHPRKGEKGTPVEFWKFHKKREKNENGTTEEKVIPVNRIFYVFNEEQLADPLTEAAKPPVIEAQPEPVQFVARLIEASGIPLSWGGDKAYYRPSTDGIRLPRPEQFHEVSEIAATGLHELIHATGAASRLNRDKSDRAREEVVAEAGAWLAAMRFGLPATPENSASYLTGWASRLKGDQAKEIDRALADAQKAVNFIEQMAQECGLIDGVDDSTAATAAA
ncbi:ArdC family protein [Modicisalibacter xianhensis]|uniref:Antirestriction protein ArdC n=1 Tax=Modicisalibacter xianhensis TaxID=442341 RepID=A0A1I3EQC8_9GAMM|nr:ArdC-like ssDNA-binding domain-containing protein [Halomonas xianhensis]SFI01206.1 Antirestriction protein ArdC [Halomonas xianhensis]